MLGDEVSGNERKRSDRDYDESNERINAQHKPECAEYRQYTRKEMGEAEEQPVRNVFDIRNHTADRISRSVRIEVRKRQLLNMPESFVTNITGYPIGHAVAAKAHQVLRKRRYSDAQANEQKVF